MPSKYDSHWRMPPERWRELRRWSMEADTTSAPLRLVANTRLTSGGRERRGDKSASNHSCCMLLLHECSSRRRVGLQSPSPLHICTRSSSPLREDRASRCSGCDAQDGARAAMSCANHCRLFDACCSGLRRGVRWEGGRGGGWGGGARETRRSSGARHLHDTPVAQLQQGVMGRQAKKALMGVDEPGLRAR
jgi:hypothetical protein